MFKCNKKMFLHWFFIIIDFFIFNIILLSFHLILITFIFLSAIKNIYTKIFKDTSTSLHKQITKFKK